MALLLDRSLFIFNFKPQHTYNLSKKEITIFIFLLISSFFILEEINKKCFVEKKAHIYKLYNNFLNKKEDAEILLIGDSHIGDDILADTIKQKTINLGIPGTGYIEFYYLLKHYIHEMPKLKILVLEIDYNNFSSYRCNSFTKFPFWNKFIDYKELEKIKGNSVSQNKFKNFTLLDDQLGRGFFVENIFTLGVKEEQWQNIKKTWGYPKEPSPEERAKSHYENRTLYNDDIFFYFKKIINLCNKNNIKVIVVQLPISNKYSTESRKYAKIDDFKKFLKINFLSDSKVYKQLDYESLFSNRQNLFKSNGDHLNNEGAQIFTEIFSKELSSN